MLRGVEKMDAHHAYNKGVFDDGCHGRWWNNGIEEEDSSNGDCRGRVRQAPALHCLQVYLVCSAVVYLFADYMSSIYSTCERPGGQLASPVR